MNRNENFEYVSEIHELESLLREIPTDRVLERIGLEARLKAAKAAIAQMEESELPLTAPKNLLLGNLIQEALSKINGKNQRDLCHFLPFLKGYMHHFTFIKMMKEDPQQLFDLIKKHIIDPKEPKKIEIKLIELSNQSNKKTRLFTISEDEMDRILNIARQAQDLDLIEKLKDKQSSSDDDQD